MRDNDILAMQFKVLCTSPNWGPKDEILVWCQDEHGKCMLPDEEPKPCTPNPRRYGPKLIKVYSDSLNIGKN